VTNVEHSLQRNEEAFLDFDDKTFVVGIGAQKTGTTWLANYLDSRREIYMSPIKEMHYFDIKYRPDICGTMENRFARRLDERAVKPNFHKKEKSDETILNLKARIEVGNDGQAYKNFFRERVPDAANFYSEITPSYALIGQTGFREMRQLFPKIRIIFIMRDPVDRFYSQVRMRDSRRPAEKVVQEDLTEKIKEALDDPRYVERSQYQKTIASLESVFKGHEVIYLFYETLFRKDTIADLCDFIGIDYVHPDFDDVVNSSGPASELPISVKKKLRAVFRPTYKFCREKFGSILPLEWRTRRDDD
jgi:hypothetical protein